MADTTGGPWMGSSEAGRRAKRHPKTVIKALRQGELRGYQNGVGGSWRIHIDDVDAWVRGERPAKTRKSA